jgi:tyrosyl-tRNA synthetase
VRDFHGAAAADAAAEGWARMFQQKAVSEDVPVVKVATNAEGLMGAEGEIKLAKLLQLAGLAASTGEATRKIAENAVSVNGEKVSERAIAKSALGEGPILRLGRRSVKVEWAG